MKKLLCALVSAVIVGGCGGDKKPTIEATGTLEATESLVSAQVSGIVQRIYVDEGSEVVQGDTLLSIDPTEYTLQLKQAQANAHALYAQYRLALKGTREEDIIQAEANYRSAKEDYERMKELYSAKSISRKQLDDAETRYIVAFQNFEKLKKGSRYEEIQTARARWEQAVAQSELLEKKIMDCTIRATMNGVVVRKYVEQGELITQGMAVLRIANINEMYVRIYVPESELPYVSHGQRADVRVDAFKNRVFSGRVTYIASIAEFTPRNVQTKDERTKLVFAVKIKVQNPEKILKAGIPADVILQ
ncbi:MAG: efflux RND transporter periplasmic adaptor subunit [Bacteroidetes bacterium]|nr:efflux RND transporter periplasmic adaptor subunit [Bacteroidota bacterium]